MYAEQLKFKPVGFHIKDKDFDGNKEVIIRVVSDVKLPYDHIAQEMSPIKETPPTEMDLNAGFDPMIKIKLPNKKVGLLFPNSIVPCDVN